MDTNQLAHAVIEDAQASLAALRSVYIIALRDALEGEAESYGYIVDRLTSALEALDRANKAV